MLPKNMINKKYPYFNSRRVVFLKKIALIGVKFDKTRKNPFLPLEKVNKKTGSNAFFPWKMRIFKNISLILIICTLFWKPFYKKIFFKVVTTFFPLRLKFINFFMMEKGQKYAFSTIFQNFD